METDKKTNALDELAKRLKPNGNKHLYFMVDYGDMCKAQRIISELAKVIDRMDAHGVVKSYPEVIGTIYRCRAIAEKEANDEGL